MSEKFSVLMPVYINEKDNELKMSIESLLNQTLIPNEILIIADRHTPKNTLNILNEYKDKFPELFGIVVLSEDANLGKTLQIGVKKAKFDIIARMDSDDIARKDRFEKQINFLKDNPNIDVVGSWISEFEDSPENIYAIREVPIENDSILQFCKFRNPMNHMTVVFRRKAVLETGNYSDRKRMEDYQLWAKMLHKGFRFANIPECLVNARAGQSLMKRRGSLKEFFQYEYTLFKEFYDKGYINCIEFLKAIVLKFFLRMAPNWIMSFIYKNILRKDTKN